MRTKICCLSALLLILASVPVAGAENPMAVEYYFDLTCETCGKYRLYRACNQTVVRIEEEYGDLIKVEWLSVAEGDNLQRFREYDVLVLPLLVFNETVFIGGQDITEMKVKETINGLIRGSRLATRAYPRQITVPLVVVSGLLDGINPCAIALLVFFISFLFGIHETRKSVFKLGSIYILGLYVTYLAIGVGLLRAINLFGVERPFAQVAVVLLVVMGLVSIRDAISHEKPLLRFAWPERFRSLTERSTALVAAAMGVLVGLGEFPCSGSIYVGVLAMLSSGAGFIEGLLYLLLYNLMFVLPLILILFSAYNVDTLAKIDTWRVKRRRRVRFASGIFLMALALITWFWLIR
jgi:cytochrome c biogenesis protein CcdA